jgi:hypothetical protein
MGGDITVRGGPGEGRRSRSGCRGAAAGERATRSARGRRAVAAKRRSRRAPAVPSDEAPLDAAHAVLRALGTRLGAQAEAVAARYVAALRADGRFPGARELPGVQLRDHATPLVGLLASQLQIIGETGGHAPELLGDGAQVQRLMAELHGAQRHRLGWTEADLEREVPLLAAETERTLLESAAGVAGAAPEAVRAAARYATVVARHMLEQAAATALRAYRFANATAGP